MTNPAPDPALAALLDEAATLCADPRLATLLHAHWPAFGRRGRRVATRIHPDDQMLLHSLRHHRDAGAAVSQYFNVALQQYQATRQIVDALFPDPSRRVELLDFACGFGRLIRFLVACDRDVEITAAEIQSEALAFVGDEFGVATVPSTMAPEAFEPGRRFDVVWVASLFSHLPEGLFHRWLARLSSLLAPGGVLCFSVHDEALLPPGDVMPPGGLLFKPHSENAALDPDAYGTTYVTERFVRAAIARAAGAGAPVRRLRKALAHEQDVYVVAADPARDLTPLDAFRRGPWGWVDERRVDAGTLVLRGWAASLDDGVLPAVAIRVDGVEHRCPTGGVRPDVGRVFGDERLATAGWTWRLPLPEGARTPWVEVTAPTPRGECALLYAGWPGGRPDAGEAPHVYRRTIDPAARSTLSVIAALVAPGSRVLDVGTGSGALGRHLREQRGCTVDGVTLSAAERDAARPAYDRLVVADLEDAGWAAPFEGRRYDAIVCADVLEHLREPARVLRACAGLLRDGGWLLASVPNVAYAGMVAELMHGRWTYGPEGLLDRTHLRFFTRGSFTRLLQEEGWRVERVEPIELTWYYTEFWTPFDRLPPTVARYLLAQPDASAYQLVFAARRAEVPAGAAAPLAAPVPPADPAVNVAVYASTLAAAPAGGGPARGVHALGRVGDAAQTIAFPIPADVGTPAHLRWYPADRPGLLHLHALRLRDRHGHVAWEWVAARDGDRWLRDAARRQIDVGAPTADGAATLLLRAAEPALDVPCAALAPAGAPWTFEADCGWPLSADYLALVPAAASGSAPAPTPFAAPAAMAAPPPREPIVEVVVPVHGQLDLVRRCLASVVDGTGAVPWHLTVIDDASPEREVGQWLREFAAVHPEATVVANARNLGFVATANLGLRLAGRRDVVLLNSDTEVPPGWLDRLHRAAVSDPRAGTVTPFSNNATICSFPRFCQDNPLPPGHTTATLDRLFAQTHAGHTVEIPTAVGFCMYIRRDCLDDVGAFDAEAFGAGYGEENDFCLRASARGWRHLHALDVFVHHAGGASFSERRQALQQQALAAMRRLHPGYEELIRAFVARDPARPAREAVERLLAGASGTGAQP